MNTEWEAEGGGGHDGGTCRLQRGLQGLTLEDQPTRGKLASCEWPETDSWNYSRTESPQHFPAFTCVCEFPGKTCILNRNFKIREKRVECHSPRLERACCMFGKIIESPAPGDASASPSVCKIFPPLPPPPTPSSYLYPSPLCSSGNEVSCFLFSVSTPTSLTVFPAGPDCRLPGGPHPAASSLPGAGSPPPPHPATRQQVLADGADSGHRARFPPHRQQEADTPLLKVPGGRDTELPSAPGVGVL